MKFRSLSLLGLLMVLIAPALRAEGMFSVHVDKRTVALGHPLTVEILARNPGKSLSALKLDPLKRDFHIDSVSISVSRHRQSGQTQVTRRMTVTVYPLRSGTLRIPTLRFAGHASRPLDVTVRRTGPDSPHVHFRAWIAPANPLVRQVTTLHLTIRDEGSVQWEPIRLPSISGLYLRRIRATQRQETIAGVQQTVRRYVWELMPLQAGDWTVPFPMLSAVSFGSPLQYPVPALHFHADPTPAYLPVYVPIGRVSVQRQSLPTRVAVGRAVNWTLTVTGRGLSRSAIIKLLGPMDSNKAARFYPPMVTRQSGASSDHTLQRWRVTVPFRPLQAGPFTLPKLSLAYFDPSTGRIASATAGGQRLVIVDPAAVWLRRSVYTIAALVLLALAGYRARTWYRRIRQRRAALARIRHAGDLRALRHALIAFAVAGDRPGPVTLRQWVSIVRDHNGGQARLAELVQQLDAAQFARGSNLSERALSDLKARTMDALRSVKATAH
ncbi:MAG: BatD family protein [Gammaproteobacteria bacterium]|jgi:hypothetical protein